MDIEAERIQRYGKIEVGDIVRGPYGRRYKVLGERVRGSYPVQRVTAKGELDRRCCQYLFPDCYLREIPK